MDPCTLTDTGINILSFIGFGAALFVMAVVAISNRRKAAVGIAVLAGILITVPVFPYQAYAQSANEQCVPGNGGQQSQSNNNNGNGNGNNEDDDNNNDDDDLSEGLHDDHGFVQLPDADFPIQWSYISILDNDIPPEGTYYDWETIDLDLNTPGIQQFIDISAPYGGHTLYCGSAEVQNGILYVEMFDSCWDEDFNSHAIPSDLIIPPIQYTVETSGGDPAPEPAEITIELYSGAMPSVVVANHDYFYQPVAYTYVSFDLVSNDTTSQGAIDPTTVDLDLITPGIQSSLEINYAGTDFVVTVDADGTITFTVKDGQQTSVRPFVLYTVQNTFGNVSNVATAGITNIPM